MKINEKNIFFVSASSKNEALKEISQKAKELKFVTSINNLEVALKKREKEYSTGFENGFAIPHARIKSVTQPSILIAKFRQGIDWNSIDNKLTKIAITLLMPDSENGAKNHLEMLSKISKALIDKDFQRTIKSASHSKIVDLINKVLEEKKNENNEKKVITNYKNVVAITACATGIAHTFMAAKKLEDIGKEKKINIRVQKNGASGPEDVLTKEEIQNADYVIIAADIKVDETPFIGKKVIKVPVAYAIKSTAKLFDNMENDYEIMSNNNFSMDRNKSKQGKKNNKSSWFYRNILTHTMNGVSHIIPLLVSAGVLLAIGKLLAVFTGDVSIADNYGKLFEKHGDAIWYKFVYFINIMGIVVLWLMFPIFGLFTAQSIGGKSAIIPGFLIGVLSDGDHLFARIWRTFNISEGNVNPFAKGEYPFIQDSAGFFGVLIGSILIGYVVFYLNKWIKIKGVLSPLKSILIVPGVTIIFAVVFQTFVINPPFALMNKWVNNLAQNSSSFVIAFGILVSIGTAFDLGGPINKAVGAVAIGLAASGTIPLTARTMSIVIPPLGLGLATLIAKPIFRKNIYDEDLKIAGRTSLFLGLIAITEGGLPFLFKRPFATIFASILGAVVGSTFAILIGAQMWQPLPAIYGWGLVGQAPMDASVKTSLSIGIQIFVYISGIIIGAITTSLVHISSILLYDRFKNRKKLITNASK